MSSNAWLERHKEYSSPGQELLEEKKCAGNLIHPSLGCILKEIRRKDSPVGTSIGR